MRRRAPGGDDPLGERAPHDGERAGGGAVVVQRRALVGQPGEQPDLGVGQVGVQRGVERRSAASAGREQVGPPAVGPVLDEVEPARCGGAARAAARPAAPVRRVTASAGRGQEGAASWGIPGSAARSRRVGTGGARKRKAGGEGGQRAGQSALATRPGRRRTGGTARTRQPRPDGIKRRYLCQVDQFDRVFVSHLLGHPCPSPTNCSPTTPATPSPSAARSLCRRPGTIASWPAWTRVSTSTASSASPRARRT